MISLNNKNLQVLRSCIALFWLGFFMAISFMEAPLKFTVLNLVDGLSVGRVVFRALNYCEWIFLAMLALTLILKTASRLATVLIGLMCLVLLLETLWLLPMLEARAMEIVKGKHLAPSGLHEVYVMLEIVKVPILVGISWLGLNRKDSN